jgi:molybdenum cofactor cytidylyltransferase
MLVREALGVRAGDVISIVGAGGKTSLALRLLAELKEEGLKVVFTTTTKFLEPIPAAGEVLILEEDEAKIPERIREAFAQGNAVILARRRLKEKVSIPASYPFPMRPYKVQGIPPEVVDKLHEAFGEAVIIVEADGARGKLLKAPAFSEPVVPSSTSIYVAMAHADALGKPIDKEFVHRPEEVARLLGRSVGFTLDEAAIASILLHPEGGMKAKPSLARFVPVVNGREEASPQKAYRIARLLLRSPEVKAVPIATLWADEPVRDIVGRVKGIILAAGKSERFGYPKQLATVEGMPMLERVVEIALASPVESVVVVLGANAESIIPILEGKPVQVVVNREWPEGIASSVRAGLLSIGPETEAAIFFLADQPFVKPETVAAVIRSYYRTRKPIVAPAYKGIRGNPVLFDRSTFLELASLRGDKGGRSVIESHPDWVQTVEVNDPGIRIDVDTPQDLSLSKEMLSM